MNDSSPFRKIDAITLATTDMRRAVRFYRALGMELAVGDENASFCTFHLGRDALNLTAETREGPPRWWGRVIIHVDNVDALYEKIRKAGLKTETAPRSASWGERYFHILDPDGHELSFAKSTINKTS